jgi:hypothetical protein
MYHISMILYQPESNSVLMDNIIRIYLLIYLNNKYICYTKFPSKNIDTPIKIYMFYKIDFDMKYLYQNLKKIFSTS